MFCMLHVGLIPAQGFAEETLTKREEDGFGALKALAQNSACLGKPNYDARVAIQKPDVGIPMGSLGNSTC